MEKKIIMTKESVTGKMGSLSFDQVCNVLSFFGKRVEMVPSPKGKI